MKKKIFFVCLFLCAFFSVFSETDCEYTVLVYYPHSVVPYVWEYKFYDDGLIKSIDVYNLKKNIDIYDWNSKKKDAVLFESYEVERTDEFLIEYCIKDGERTEYKKINKEEYLSEKKRQEKVIQYWILDDNLKKARFVYEQPVQEKHNFKVSFDNKNVYTMEIPMEKHGDRWFEKYIYYISGYIQFSDEARLFNNSLKVWIAYFDCIFEMPVIQKERYEYSNTEKDTLIFSRQEINISTSRGKENLKDVSIEDINGMSYVFLEGKKQGLLLKNSDFSVYYRENDETPFFMGWSSSQNRKIVEQTEIKSSTFLKEGKVSYVAENVKELKLKAPWAEGAEGNGEGEYIQFNKAEADGMYIVNGYVSMDRPDLYEKNGRVKEFTVTGLKSGIVQEEYILDSAKPQYVSLKAFENEPVRITVKSVYSGTKYEDTCISGIVLVKEN